MRILERMRAALAASSALARWQERGTDAWQTKATILALCLALQVAFWLLLRNQGEILPAAPRAPERILELVLIEDAPPPPSVAPPPAPRRNALRSLRAVRIDPPAVPELTHAPDAPPWPPGRPLSSQVPGLGTTLGEVDDIGVLDPMRPRAARIPGRETAIVGGFHVRRERTPEDVVRIVGGFLFGGNYDPCPDLQGKVHDATILNPGRYSDAERRAMIERERRCRY